MKYAINPSKKSRATRHDATGMNHMTGDTALNLVDSIISDVHVADEFFFKTMLPKMEALADNYKRSFGLDIKAEDIAAATYISCREDNWAKLQSYKGLASPYSWVAKIALQATYQRLVDERYLNLTPNTKSTDYRLTLRGIDNVDLRQTIIDLLPAGDEHQALQLYYVEKMPDKYFFTAYGREEKAKEILKKAEKALVKHLLSTENPFAEIALSSKKAINPEVTFQSWHDRIDEGDLSENHYDFRHLLTRLFKCEDWDANVNTLINIIIKSLHWTELQEDVWRQRFIYETPSKVLAHKYHVHNSWVDNVFSRLNRQFRIAIRTWWEKYNR